MLLASNQTNMKLVFDFCLALCIITKKLHPWPNWIWRVPPKDEVTGSNPVGCAKNLLKFYLTLSKKLAIG